MPICFEVRINDEQPTVAGLADINVLTALFTFVAAHRELSLRVGGLISRSEHDSEHLEWLERDLTPGDAVTIRIVESDAPAEPAERRRDDPSFLAKQERAYYEHLRRKYEQDGA